MTTENATATITLPEGTTDAQVTVFARDPEVFEHVKAEHPEGRYRKHGPNAQSICLQVWHWTEGDINFACHGPDIRVRVVEELVSE